MIYFLIWFIGVLFFGSIAFLVDGYFDLSIMTDSWYTSNPGYGVFFVFIWPFAIPFLILFLTIIVLPIEGFVKLRKWAYKKRRVQ